MTELALLPAFAAGANVSLLASNSGRAHPVNRALFAVYFLLAGLNTSAFFMISASSREEAMLALFVLRHFLFFLPTGIMASAAVISGRSARHPLILFSAVCALVFISAADITYFTGSRMLVRDVIRHEWGWFPLLQPGALGGIVAANIIGLLASAYFLARPHLRLDFLNYKILTGIYIVWWLGLMLNFFPLGGADMRPIGNGVDALVCVIVSSVLHRRRTSLFSDRGLVDAAAELLTSASAGLLGAFVLFAAAGLDPARVSFSVCAVAGALVHIQFQRQSDGRSAPERALPLSGLGLSRQEERICELIAEGYAKSALLLFLNISDGTLRNHLGNIYAKTIHKGAAPDTSRRDHFQRLTVFLSKLQKT